MTEDRSPYSVNFHGPLSRETADVFRSAWEARYQGAADAQPIRIGDHICVDLDGCLAHFDHWRGPEHIGDPVPAMLARVKAWRAAGIEVRIFTARVSREPGNRQRDLEVFHSICAIQDWCQAHLGERLAITCEKSFRCVAIYDDKAFRVVANEGRIVSSATGEVE